MTTLQEGILGTVIGGFILYLGNLLHTYYIKQKIEGIPDFGLS